MWKILTIGCKGISQNFNFFSLFAAQFYDLVFKDY